MTDTEYYIICFLLCPLSILLLRFFNIPTKTTTTLRLPPSPPSLPVIGHLHLLTPSICISFHSLSSQYGPLLYLRLGVVRCLLISSASMATEIFKTHDAIFSSRPNFAFENELPYGSLGMAASPYGEYWRFMKKFTMTELLAPRQLDRSWSVRKQEIERFLRKIFETAKRGEVVDVGGELMKLTNNITCRMVMSTRCSENVDEAEKVRYLVKEIFEKAVKVSFGDVFGWPLKRLAFWLYGKQVMDVTLRFDELLEKILKQHEERGRREGFEREDTDLMDILLKVYKDEKAEFKITRTHLKAFLLDLFLGGTATSSEVMQWLIAELINHPPVFNKLREEIKSVVGNKLVEESDIPNLPYLQAVVKEALRLYPPVPVVPRLCRQACKIQGFDIPQKTIVSINLYAIMRDPNLWDNPNEFKPERFLLSPTENNSEGDCQNGGSKGQCYSFVPFGGGRRGCPGSGLAFGMINTVIGTMVQCFDWKVYGNGDEAMVNMQIGSGMSLPMARPLMCLPVAYFDPLAEEDIII